MRFQHSEEIWRDFPLLAAGAVVIQGETWDRDVTRQSQRFLDRADARLQGLSESELPEIQAWRRAFAQMGLKPTQYRCAAEALLRRYRKDKALPQIHPLVNLCNAVSMAYAIPVAVFDLDRVEGNLEVRYANGAEVYLTFSGEIEHPAPGEVVFADAASQAHARRWTNRQSALSAVRPDTARALIIGEALHDDGAADVAGLLDELQNVLSVVRAEPDRVARLSSDQPAITIS
ncbi:MAG TPA: phenylalanine--tRNA ligase beta subunit-related protein [Propionibacteriaceae bacterium]|jgi:DNA/RNA-binding domain of Phe-tRNA-synthetase-like protein